MAFLFEALRSHREILLFYAYESNSSYFFVSFPSQLVVTDVLAGGQAAMYTLALKESEVVAVNGARIM